MWTGSKTEFTVFFTGINTIVHKDNTDVQFGKSACIIQGIYSISCKSTYFFCQDKVDPTILTVCDHSIKALTLFDRRSGDTLVHLNYDFDTMSSNRCFLYNLQTKGVFKKLLKICIS